MKIIYTIIFTNVIALFSISPSLGQDCNSKIFEDALFEKIIGKWSGSGKVGSDSIGYDIEASWELNHQFIELTISDTTTIPQYSAKVYISYDCISERYVVHWLDTFGARYSETLGYGTKKGHSVAFRFEYPNGPFINKFIYDNENDTWRFYSTTKSNTGEWVNFGDIRLRKIKPGE
jgi:hypothetical protein